MILVKNRNYVVLSGFNCGPRLLLQVRLLGWLMNIKSVYVEGCLYLSKDTHSRNKKYFRREEKLELHPNLGAALAI